MDLLKSAWIPVRADGGFGPFRLLRYEELLCSDQHWTISLPRDDLALAAIQLLACMTQIIFLPPDDPALRASITKPLKTEKFVDQIAPFQEWFDLDHPTQPFMQTRNVQAKEATPIQKLLIGLPEGNNHAFFNEVGEVKQLGSTVTAIALFNQASNCPSFGGGFKGSLRGGAPVTTLVAGRDLRETVWRNVLTLPRVQDRLPDYEPDFSRDVPTWIKPIRKEETIHALQIGLARGLLWQPAHVELIPAAEETPCDLLGGLPGPVYSGFRKEKFNFTVNGVWPHPHGAFMATVKKGVLEQKFVSFTTTAPAWTLLTAFVVPSSLDDRETKEGCTPAGPITQATDMGIHQLHLIVGGYHTKQASVIERRHELIGLANGWQDDKDRLKQLVDLGKAAKKSLRGKLYFAAQGSKDKGMKGIGAAIYETGEQWYYSRTESLFHEVFNNERTFKEWKEAKVEFLEKLTAICKSIFQELTDPYAHKPELIPIIAWMRRSLDKELSEKIFL